jgi:hypothetical protein
MRKLALASIVAATLAIVVAASACRKDDGTTPNPKGPPGPPSAVPSQGVQSAPAAPR